MTTYKIVRHNANQHGWSVSIARCTNDVIQEGFVLTTEPTEEQQEKYIRDLQASMLIAVVDRSGRQIVG